VIAITHDRYFLTNVAGWILELDRGSASVERELSSWLDQKQARLSNRRRLSPERQKTLQRSWSGFTCRQGSPAKGKARINAYEALLSQDMEHRIKIWKSTIPPGPRLGTSVIKAMNVSKPTATASFSRTCRFDLPAVGSSASSAPTARQDDPVQDDRGQEKPDSGTIAIGETVRLGLRGPRPRHSRPG